MSIIDTLITARTQADVTKLKSLLSKPKAMWTQDEWSESILARDKGAYNATDLNRVQEAMEYLAERFRAHGKKISIKRPAISGNAPSESSSIPSNFTQLEYIQSSGTQYVDTNFKPNQNTKLEIKVQTTQTTGGGIAVCDTAWQSNGFGIWVNAAGYGNATTQNVAFYGEEPITAILDRNTLYKDGELVWTATESTFQTTHTLTLMALRRNGNMSEYLTGKLYYCRLWDNGTLVRDFIPAKTVADEVGLYDKVFKQFYRNAGTGTFTAGPEIGSVGVTERDYWKIGDIPSHEHMDLYLSNLNTIREVFGTLQTTPNTPDDMDELDFQEANNIEKILVDVNFVLLSLSKSLFYANEIFCGEV